MATTKGNRNPGLFDLTEWQREVIGCTLYGCHDPLLRWWHFRSLPQRLIFDWLTGLRRHGYLHNALAETNHAMQALAALENAVMLATNVERLDLWPWSPGIRHELVVECFDRIGDWHLEHFHDTVGTLIRESECQREITRLADAIAELQRSREVAV